jgi:hypothetical protein
LRRSPEALFANPNNGRFDRIFYVVGYNGENEEGSSSHRRSPAPTAKREWGKISKKNIKIKKINILKNKFIKNTFFAALIPALPIVLLSLVAIFVFGASALFAARCALRQRHRRHNNNNNGSQQSGGTWTSSGGSSTTRKQRAINATGGRDSPSLQQPTPTSSIIGTSTRMVVLPIPPSPPPPPHPGAGVAAVHHLRGPAEGVYHNTFVRNRPKGGHQTGPPSSTPSFSSTSSTSRRSSSSTRTTAPPPPPAPLTALAPSCFLHQQPSSLGMISRSGGGGGTLVRSFLATNGNTSFARRSYGEYNS